MKRRTVEIEVPEVGDRIGIYCGAKPDHIIEEIVELENFYFRLRLKGNNYDDDFRYPADLRWDNEFEGWVINC
jgi:hypothetical protein